ncbi:RDD family protein [Fodinibius halophilus]|uniref:RDD family protein n=1 Tax=Fodinibius halophilus TaxID=1736908 RepID=A0A6M1TDM5_9BACT|nr:RDD family protein [Fodinibius halophilus]NGP88272.1 RDD family protein [Fodinibius halophilus]
MEHLNIETSHHVQIDYSPAGIGARLGAYALDIIIMTIYFVVLYAFVFDAVKPPTWMIILVLVLPLMSYHLIFELFMEGQSPGKKVAGIKVIKTDGTPATFGNYVMRWVFRLIEITSTSGTVAFITILINGKGQRLGDLAAGTAVVESKKKTSLSDTLYTDFEEDYEPVYPEVSVLTDKDISIIKEVLNERKAYDRQTYKIMAMKTRNAIQEKMGIEKAREKGVLQFLRTVVKDYNVIHG